MYKQVNALLRAYANLANEMEDAGYTPSEAADVRQEVKHYELVRQEVKFASGDYLDMKMFEPAMRHLLDAYIRAEETEVVSAFDDLGLVELIVEQGLEALEKLPQSLRTNPEAMAETIENNVRKVIIDEQPVNPKYYAKMSALLDALIQQRKAEALSYKAYLRELVELTAKVKKTRANRELPPGHRHCGQAGALRQPRSR